MEDGHMGFEDLTPNMLCVPWFVPKSHMEASRHGQGFSVKNVPTLQQLISSMISEITRMNLQIMEHGFCLEMPN